MPTRRINIYQFIYIYRKKGHSCIQFLAARAFWYTSHGLRFFFFGRNALPYYVSMSKRSDDSNSTTDYLYIVSSLHNIFSIHIYLFVIWQKTSALWHSTKREWINTQTVHNFIHFKHGYINLYIKVKNI